ncbi:T9SS type A sorting domain-containing protein [Geofilum sp. OHC36d9]|uniref:T9SS type A sorting domain-containing protein n=1 Tax=Geofilum sp. OHC36d9 TaxID=3458413 RepID=UPI004034C9F9
MKTIVSIILFFLIFFDGIGNAQLIAFPGAHGYGRFASGGRGNGTSGRVAIVTNLEDDLENPPEGSFRWALQQGVDVVINPYVGEIEVKRPLTIVFQVGGVINLKGDIRVQRDNLTIAGQTALGDGVCFRGATLNFSGSNNLIVRYIRSRPGDELGEEVSAFRIENGSNFIIDHCSFSWAIEETTHFSSNNGTTVQWCIISESLYNSIHKKGARGYGTQWGGEYASYHHNLLAHHNSRMPRINGSNSNDVESLVDYRNNINYNWGSVGAFYGGEWEGTNGLGFSHVNVVNNYFKPGPATPSDPIFARPSLNRSGVTLDGYAKWFFDGNTMEGDEIISVDNWSGVDGSEVGGIDNIQSDEVLLKTVEIQDISGYLENYDQYTETAAQAWETVLANAGAVLPMRDAIDARVVAETKGEIPIVRYAYTTVDDQTTPLKGVTSGIIDTQVNLVSPSDPEGTTAWDVYSTSTSELAPVDTDRDGIPDEWEIINGLNYQDETDGRILSASGYSWLELYLFDLSGEDVPTEVKFTETNNDVCFYPNPVADKLFISTYAYLIKVELYNSTGLLLAVFKNIDSIGQISLTDLYPGVYIIRVYLEGNQILTKKIVKL